MGQTNKVDIVALGKALVAATNKAKLDRDPAPLATALSQVLAAKLPHNCAAAVRARKLLDSLKAENIDVPKVKSRKKREPRQIKRKVRIYQLTVRTTKL